MDIVRYDLSVRVVLELAICDIKKVSNSKTGDLSTHAELTRERLSTHLVNLLTEFHYPCTLTTPKLQTPDTTVKAYGQLIRSLSSSTRSSSEEANERSDEEWRITVSGRMSGNRIPSLPDRLTVPARSSGKPFFFLVELKSPIHYDTELLALGYRIWKLCNFLKKHYIVLKDNRREREQDNEGQIPRFCVHVGWNYSSVMPMATVEANRIVRLMAILWAFEGQLNKLHPSYTQWNTKAQQMTPNCSFTYNATPLQALRQILECKTTLQVLNLMQHREKGAKLDIADAYSGDQFRDGHCPMFEFNQHESTMNPKRIIYWVSVCVALVKKAHADDHQNQQLLIVLQNQIYFKNNHGLSDFLGEPLAPFCKTLITKPHPSVAKYTYFGLGRAGNAFKAPKTTTGSIATGPASRFEQGLPATNNQFALDNSILQYRFLQPAKSYTASDPRTSHLSKHTQAHLNQESKDLAGPMGIIERAKLARLNDIFAQSSKDFLMSQRGSGKQTGYMATMMGKLERTKRKRVESSAMGSGDRKRVRWEGENSGGSGGSYLLKDGYHSGDFEYGGGY